MDLYKYRLTQLDKFMAELVAKNLYELDRPVDMDDEEKIRCMLSCAFRNGVAYGRKVTKKKSEQLLKNYAIGINPSPKAR